MFMSPSPSSSLVSTCINLKPSPLRPDCRPEERIFRCIALASENSMFFATYFQRWKKTAFQRLSTSCIPPLYGQQQILTHRAHTVDRTSHRSRGDFDSPQVPHGCEEVACGPRLAASAHDDSTRNALLDLLAASSTQSITRWCRPARWIPIFLERITRRSKQWPNHGSRKGST
ncbi:hypothetical protein BDM02DRAFT_2870715 [Thelephora ganbajun]|uniref:Uncharacterized protein n=1 Tax=Thelephora ganbajun TaxID=370292 RepID=A0ACB6ZAX5_THEGA|nr:hypothetical protein BDM02DRAFT_2870715 [Thelephora ganbajun]